MDAPMILVVASDPRLRRQLADSVTESRGRVESLGSGEAALERLKTTTYAAVLCEMQMPEIDGLDVLRAARESPGAPPVILVSTFSSVPLAVQAMQEGAASFLDGPVSAQDVAEALERALPEVPAASAATSPTASLAGTTLVGDPAWLSPFMESLARVAQADCTVLLQGETGTGKSTIAREIQRRSRRAKAPFVELNCAAIPEHLLESILFGHVRGAFTGATTARAGKVEAAEGGTLFLDEIGELKPALQAKLLHLLQERVYTPVGASKPRRANLRFIAATNRDLEAEVRAGRFRADLYFRLNVITLRVPPLRERQGDVPLLIEAYRQRVASRTRLESPRFTDEALMRLQRHAWPGNIRELENLVERMTVLHPGATIGGAELDRVLAGAAAAAPSVTVDRRSAPVGPPTCDEIPTRGGAELPPELGEAPLRALVDSYERLLIEGALRRSQGNKSRAARLLRVKRTTLLDKLRRYDLTA